MTIESKLDTLQEQLNTVCELLQMTINILNTKKAVSKFLNKSEKTIDNYIKNNTFIKGKHYFINENNRIEFIPFAIVDFKKNPQYKLKILEDKDNVQKEKVIEVSSTTSKILKGIV